MKFLVLTFLLIAVVTIDCRSQSWSDSQHSIIADQSGWPDDFTPGTHNSEDKTLMTDGGPQEPGATLGSHNSEEVASTFDNLYDLNDPKGKRENGKISKRESTCGTKNSCAIRGGSCKDMSKPCMGKSLRGGCEGRYCLCCIPGCPEGFIQPSGPTNQCYKILTDKRRNWYEANSTCIGLGLSLAEPYDAISLKSYITQRYGPDARAWLGARGNGSTFLWQRDGRILRKDNPLWMTGYPGSRLSTSNCLEFSSITDQWRLYPKQTYYAATCASRYFYALCELIMP